MKILLVHNRYRQAGGEDAVFEAEKTLLQQEGHEVREYVRHNKEIEGKGTLTAAVSAIWSRQSYLQLKQVLTSFAPNVAHFHNVFLLVSPAAYYACQETGVPVIQTLHNYRLLCPAATFLRDGQICEDCLGKTPPWPGVWHGCWRGSRSQTAVPAAVLTFHRLVKTWEKQVNCYLALTHFARSKFIEAGFSRHKIVVKPNFATGISTSESKAGRTYALFVGRLSPEKGIDRLLEAWQKLGDIPLKMVGDGPSMDRVKEFAQDAGGRLEILGWRTRDEVQKLMQGARFLVFPSQWYEGFPLTLAEAFACGTPVIASRLGAMAELVMDGQTGLHFEAGNTESLAGKIKWAWAHPREMEGMGDHARREYEKKYTAEKNYAALMEIYESVIAGKHG